MRAALPRAIAVATCSALIGCFSPTVDANRELWQGFRETCPDAAPKALGGEVRVENLGVSILARDVLGQAFPEDVQRVLTERAARDAQPPQEESVPRSEEVDTRASQALCRQHVFGQGAGAKGWTASEEGRVVPEDVADTALLQEYVKALSRDSAGDDNATEIELDRGDVFEFAKAAYRLSSDPIESEKTSGGRLVRLYLSAYVEGKYVDRRGRPYAKPTILHPATADKGASINVSGNEIADIAAIALEGLLDAAFRTPVLYEEEGGKKVYLTEEHRIPTFAALLGIEEALVEPGEEGIAELEQELISFASGLAGTKSKALAGLVISSLKEWNIELVFGADFAVGDSQALRLLVEAIFEVASRQITEELSYQALRCFEYELDGHKVVPLDTGALARTIGLLLQEQELLKKLVPPQEAPAG
jgi:hypothetical protein